MRKAILFTLITASVGAMAQIPSTRVDFSADTAEENGITIMGADFNTIPQAEISYGPVPTDNVFDGATDGRGAAITADPGEGLMILGNSISTPHAGIIRCSVRSDSRDVSVTIAGMDRGTDQFVSTNGPADGSPFLDRYSRLTTLYTPPDIGFTPIIQMVNRSETESVTVYLDNFDVILLEPGKYYASEFLDGDETDPPVPTVEPEGQLNPETGLWETTIKIPGLPKDTQPLVMVLMPPGTFTMGSPMDESGRADWEWPPHEVAITEPFYISKYEITQAQWEAVMGTNPAKLHGVGDDYPVYYVSWNDCREFIDKLNGLDAGVFRFPTEAEWEYACRTGTETRFFFGDALECEEEGYVYCESGDHHMWWLGNDTLGDNVHGSKEVGRKEPNAWGLHDMHGNVWEWCSDYWEDSYERGTQTDPTGPATGVNRVIRGGDANDEARYCRSAYRDYYPPDDPDGSIGIRLVREYGFGQ